MSFFKDRSALFQTLCNKNKLVAHNRTVDGEVRNAFHRMNHEEELQAACVNFAHFPCVVHWGFSGRYTSEKQGLPKRKHTNALLFLHKADNALSMNDTEDAYDTAFQVMEEFISRLYSEYISKGYCGNFHSLDLSRFSFHPYELNGNLFGWQLQFEDDVFVSNMTSYDTSKWFE